MTTRDGTRRELQDLAKLAATMRKDAAPKPSRPTLQRPSTPTSISKLTVPPAVASVPPPSVAPVVTAPRPTPRRRGTLVAVSAVLGLAIAVAGGVQVGKYFAQRGQPALASTPAPVLVPAAVPPALPPALPPPAVPTAVAAAAPPPVAQPTPAPSASVATVAPVSKTNARPQTQPRRWQPRPTVKSARAVAVPASGGGDSLDIAIRQAVASAPPK